MAEGTLGQDNLFRADSVLAKHDERYMPREVADALKKQGVWQGGGTQESGQEPPRASRHGHDRKMRLI